jgi:hypothetical protein
MRAAAFGPIKAVPASITLSLKGKKSIPKLVITQDPAPGYIRWKIFALPACLKNRKQPAHIIKFPRSDESSFTEINGKGFAKQALLPIEANAVGSCTLKFVSSNGGATKLVPVTVKA